MPTDRQLDDRISRWLEAEAPTQLPDRVLRATFERTRTTRQQAGWRAVLRRLQMNRLIFALEGTAAVVVVAAIALGLYSNQPGIGGPPPPAASPTPTPSAGPTEPQGVLYTSERHRYSLLLPDETWTVEELPGSWPLGDTFNQDGPGADSVSKEADEPGPSILLNSQPVPSGTTLEHWVTDYDEASRVWFPSCRIERTETGGVGGETARVNSYLCAGTEHAIEAVTLHGGRAYVVRVFGPESDPSLDPRPILDEWLSRFRFN